MKLILRQHMNVGEFNDILVAFIKLNVFERLELILYFRARI